MDPVTITNFSLRLNDLSNRWSVVAGIDNLTDEVYPIAGNSSLDTSSGYAEVIYSRERTYYLSAKYKF
jgi:iron complex outermembrane receptor protein